MRETREESQQKKKLLSIVSALCIFVLLFQFNNCSKNNSQLVEYNSLAASSYAQNNTANNQADTPVNSSNPYVLQCVSSSDGVRVSTKLNHAVRPQKLAANGRMSTLDWAQDTDLIITLDNRCIVDSNYSDSMMNYVTTSEIQTDKSFTVYILKKKNIDNLKLFIERADQSNCLIAAEKNEEVKVKADVADPYFNYQSHLNSIGATDAYVASVMSYNSAALYATKVAIVDTGVDYTHPDLNGQMARDASGQIIGYNSTTESTAYNDSGYHGTHVAGLIAAGFRNGYMGAGVYGRNISIYPVRGSNDGETFKFSDLANGIIWAADKGVDIINLSLGTNTESLAIKNAISYAMAKNILVVVAAGNDGLQLNSTNTMYPAMYSTQFAGLITVGSIDIKSTTLSSFSNYSSTYVDILAPGSNGTTGIYSTLPMSKVGNVTTGFGAKIKLADGSYSVIHGTSMATPLVTGTLAAAISLAKSKSFSLSNTELKALLKSNGVYKISSYSSYATSGNYLNFQGLIEAIKTKIETSSPSTPTTPTTTQDSVSISLQPITKKAVIGEKTELVVTAVSNTTISYQWYHNGFKIDGATSAIYTVNSLSQSDAGVYFVEMTAGTAQTKSQIVDIKVALRYCTSN